MRHNIEFTILTSHAGWRRSLRGLDALVAELTQAAETHLRTQRKLPKGEICILLTDDKEVQELNHQFRGRNKPTNVLSFPQFTRAQLGRLKPQKPVPHLGDIALAYQYIVGEAKDNNKFLKNHVRHLIIHGLLHILGYDHETDREAHRMERLEKEILAMIGIPDPYQPVVKADGRKRGQTRQGTRRARR